MDYAGEVVYRGNRFNIERLTGTDDRGRNVTRDVVRHPGAVVILPILDAQRIVMINNYRVSIQKTLLELPAGTREPNEPPEETAARELIEETGYRAGRIELLTKFYASPGVMDELMWVYVATDLTEGDHARESGEEIENRILTWNEARTAMAEGQIQDAKSLVGLLLYLQRAGGSL